jgi:hypothetical protein
VSRRRALFRAWIIDARGRRVAIGRPEKLDRATDQRMRAWLREHGLFSSVGWRLLTVVAWPLAAGALFMRFFAPTIALVTVTAGMLLWWIGFTDARCRMARAIVASGRCARCMYALDGLEADDDDVVICPECGAAWRFRRDG